MRNWALFMAGFVGATIAARSDNPIDIGVILGVTTFVFCLLIWKKKG